MVFVALLIGIFCADFTPVNLPDNLPPGWHPVHSCPSSGGTTRNTFYFFKPHLGLNPPLENGMGEKVSFQTKEAEPPHASFLLWIDEAKKTTLFHRNDLLSSSSQKCLDFYAQLRSQRIPLDVLIWFISDGSMDGLLKNWTACCKEINSGPWAGQPHLDFHIRSKQSLENLVSEMVTHYEDQSWIQRIEKSEKLVDFFRSMQTRVTRILSPGVSLTQTKSTVNPAFLR